MEHAPALPLPPCRGAMQRVILKTEFYGLTYYLLHYGNGNREIWTITNLTYTVSYQSQCRNNKNSTVTKLANLVGETTKRQPQVYDVISQTKCLEQANPFIVLQERLLVSGGHTLNFNGSRDMWLVSAESSLCQIKFGQLINLVTICSFNISELNNF